MAELFRAYTLGAAVTKEELCPECKKGIWLEVGPIPGSIPLSILFRCTSCDAGCALEAEDIKERKMKWFIDEDEFVLTSDDAPFTPSELPSQVLRFSLESDLVKTIIETGLANVPLGDLIRKDIEEEFARRLRGIVSAKEQLYEKAALVLEEWQGDATLLDP